MQIIHPVAFRDKQDSKMIIADTVFLWTIKWFYFYEIWLISGQWCGRRQTSSRK